ncbi:gamma-glutamylcyclotransferase family protein [Rubripirellula reticaptiva]|uniref:AIG2-like family protein n=1 Tax=Rubripirellula reticaptiva TaxID=2528013 RepID=A0A5C6ERH7_9BACT|nr:gamma-glutamylcyclotransferase family protein [Rubripirellula reticaptiva]TWU51642.1 AIG2-like family protein [Rubripirellula reticaptiva]
MIDHVFVYGTLKTGQCRGGLWPAKPLSVQPAWVRGTLYGRHDYPAMMPGNDRVLGQVWSFDPSDMTTVMRVLDQIEGTSQPGYPDLYVRATLPTFGLDNAPIALAHAYHYAKPPELDGFTKIVAIDDPPGFAQWPAVSMPS